MKNKILEEKLSHEILDFLTQRQTLHLASLDEDKHPYASYAPFAIGDDCLYVLLSDIAVHGKNLKINPQAAVLIVEDESQAQTIFARIRVTYQVNAEHLAIDTEAYRTGIQCLFERHGDRIHNLAGLSDFNLFKLIPIHGRYVKDFGRAYSIEGQTLTGENINHLRDGHKPRMSA